MDNSENKYLVGWREWCTLPSLAIPAIKVKIDTGAKTSALHAFNIKRVEKKSRTYVRFSVHPLQDNAQLVIDCESPVVDERSIMSSNGLREFRYIIITTISLGQKKWDIELSLSNRDPLTFRMLLGRQALENLLVDPSHSYFQKKFKKSELRNIYL